MEPPTLRKEDDIKRAISDNGMRFRLGAEVKHLEVWTGTMTHPEYVAEALRNSASITNLKINHAWHTAPEKVELLLDSLQHSRSLQELDIVSSSNEIYIALGRLLKENRSLNSLSVTGLGCMKSKEFYYGLEKNLTLTRIELRPVVNYSIDLINHDFKRIVGALRQNTKIKRFEVKSHYQGEEDRLNVAAEKCLSVGQAECLCIVIERESPVEQFAWTDHNWEAFATFLKENCPKRVIQEQIYPPASNLSSKTFADRLAVHAVNLLLVEANQQAIALSSSLAQKIRKSQALTTEIDELQAKLEVLQTELNQVESEVKTDSNSLFVKNSAVINLRANLKKFQEALDSNEPALKSWQRTLNIDINKWGIEDVLFLLSEIGLKSHSAEFERNKVDGSVLLILDTNELVHTLQLAFKDAKKLLMYVHLVQTYHDIYVIPPGVLQWNNDTVCTWLEDNKFGHLVDVFKKHKITGAELAFLEKGDLSTHLKIQALGDIVKLHKELSRLKTSLSAEESSLQAQLINNNNVYQTQLEELKRLNEELKLALQERDTKIPEAFICPITQDMMVDPVVASDGHTYERIAIEQWLQNNNSSPMTGLQLANKQLTPSHTLKSMIREFIDANKKK